MRPFVCFVTAGFTLISHSSCKPSVSNVQAFGRGYSQQSRAGEIACSLIRAGFLDLPRPGGRAAYEYTDAFFADRDMVDLFTCIADAESTLGSDPSTNYNYNDTRGVFQIKNFHATSGEFPACSGQDLRQLDANTRCAADIYRSQGLGAWEVIALGSCRASQVEKIRCPDSSLDGRRGGGCGLSMRPRFSPDGSTLEVAVASDCGATSASIILMNVQGGRATSSSPPFENRFSENGVEKLAVFNLGSVRTPQHTHVRIALLSGGQVVYQTNPSPALPAQIGVGSGGATGFQPSPGYYPGPTGQGSNGCEGLNSRLACVTNFNCRWVDTAFSGYCTPM